MMPFATRTPNHLRRKSREVKMIAAFIKVNVKPGKKEKLLDLFKWDAQVARDDEPATLRFDYFEIPDDDSVVYLYEAYVGMAGFEKHKQGEPFKAFIGGIKDECIESMEGIVPGWTTATGTSAE